jgi:hypothetical protein
MRINEKHLPVLRYLKWEKPLQYHKNLEFPAAWREDAVLASFYASKYIYPNWPIYAKDWRSNIDVLSMSFLDALITFSELDNRPAFLISNIFGNHDVIKASLIIPYNEGGHWFLGYKIERSSDNEAYISMARFDDGNTLGLFIPEHTLKVNEQFQIETDIIGNHTLFISTADYGPAKDDAVGHLCSLAKLVLSYIMFKKYATVETVYLSGKSKRLLPNSTEKALNESGLNMTYYDCSWFTTIIRTEGFKVRGHFRLQPYKDNDGKWQKKLIYINGYEKHGYTRKAKIILQNKD